MYMYVACYDQKYIGAINSNNIVTFTHLSLYSTTNFPPNIHSVNRISTHCVQDIRAHLHSFTTTTNRHRQRTIPIEYVVLTYAYTLSSPYSRGRPTEKALSCMADCESLRVLFIYTIFGFSYKFKHTKYGRYMHAHSTQLPIVIKIKKICITWPWLGDHNVPSPLRLSSHQRRRRAVFIPSTYMLTYRQ